MRTALWHWWRWRVGRPDVVCVKGKTLLIDAWSRRGTLYLRRSAVPHLRNVSTYSVLSRSTCREPDGRIRPLWLSVAQGRVDDWSVKPIQDAAFDQWGRRIGGPRD